MRDRTGDFRSTETRFLSFTMRRTPPHIDCKTPEYVVTFFDLENHESQFFHERNVCLCVSSSVSADKVIKILRPMKGSHFNL